MKLNKFKCTCGCDKLKTLIFNIKKDRELLECKECRQRWRRVGLKYKEEK
ncbi:hypothetical protein [Clostridium sp. DJ247]|nr:hypothetical protein [Clostridium sp. DJ247]MBC2581038.1 hypothetical protein [Clostridium sp. DJ247]